MGRSKRIIRSGRQLGKRHTLAFVERIGFTEQRVGWKRYEWRESNVVTDLQIVCDRDVNLDSAQPIEKGSLIPFALSNISARIHTHE